VLSPSGSCVCGPGKFFDQDKATCVPCAVGTFKEGLGELTSKCSPCTNGRTTLNPVGASEDL
jgi:hypothetical protein